MSFKPVRLEVTNQVASPDYQGAALRIQCVDGICPFLPTALLLQIRPIVALDIVQILQGTKISGMDCQLFRAIDAWIDEGQEVAKIPRQAEMNF